MLMRDSFIIGSATDDRNLVLSYGPCQVCNSSKHEYVIKVSAFHAQAYIITLDCLFWSQFPTLGFIVERYWEIQAHEPEEFWSINCSHKSDEGISSFSWM